MAVKVQAFRAQRATLQVVVVITIHQASKSVNKKVTTMSKNTKPHVQYPENKPSKKKDKISGKKRSNNLKP